MANETLDWTDWVMAYAGVNGPAFTGWCGKRVRYVTTPSDVVRLTKAFEFSSIHKPDTYGRTTKLTMASPIEGTPIGDIQVRWVGLIELAYLSDRDREPFAKARRNVESILSQYADGKPRIHIP